MSKKAIVWIIVIVVVVGLGVWWYTSRQSSPAPFANDTLNSQTAGGQGTPTASSSNSRFLLQIRLMQRSIKTWAMSMLK